MSPVYPYMTRIIAEISVSLDGFVTGPDPGPEKGLGVDATDLASVRCPTSTPRAVQSIQQSWASR
jgi:hypothetical protein